MSRVYPNHTGGVDETLSIEDKIVKRIDIAKILPHSERRSIHDENELPDLLKDARCYGNYVMDSMFNLFSHTFCVHWDTMRQDPLEQAQACRDYQK